jgi:hypothetical protein
LFFLFFFIEFELQQGKEGTLDGQFVSVTAILRTTALWKGADAGTAIQRPAALAALSKESTPPTAA